MKTKIARIIGIVLWLAIVIPLCGIAQTNNQGYFMPPPPPINLVPEPPVVESTQEAPPVEVVEEKAILEEPEAVPQVIEEKAPIVRPPVIVEKEISQKSEVIIQDYSDQAKVEDALSSMASLRAVLTKTDEQIQNVISAMNFLAKQDEASGLMDNPLTKQFKKFIREIKKTETHVEALNDAAATMQEKAGSYFAAWELNLESFTNNSLRNRSRRRLTILQRDFDNITREIDRLKTKIEPFVAQLQDTRNFLNYDLNTQAIESISDVFTRNNLESGRLLEQITSVVEKLDALSDSMSP